MMPLLPENFHDMPVYYASGVYWYNDDNSVKGDEYMGIYLSKLRILESQYSSYITDPVLDDGGGRDLVNPNLTISL